MAKTWKPKPIKTEWRYVLDVGTGIVHDLGKEREGCRIGEIDRAKIYRHPMHALVPVVGIRPEPCSHCKPDLKSWAEEAETSNR